MRPLPQAKPEITLRSAEFRKVREESWRRLDDMVNRVEKSGPGTLSAFEAQEIALLYRAAASSLSVARNIALDRNLLLYLENLTLRGYLVVYGPRIGITQNLANFFARDFPRAVRSAGRHLCVVSIALLVGIIAGYALVRNDVNYFNLLVPSSLAGSRGPESSAADLITEELFAPWPGFVRTFVVFANALFRHNAIVGIFSFGLGFALGIPTILLISWNGVILGAFLALHARLNLAADFAGWLMIPGVTEILAILLCGAAGLVVAENILFPGRLSRIDSLALHGRSAAGIAAGCVALFFIAGLIEGGFRELISNTPGRFAFAGATAALWAYYFIFTGRDKR